MNTNRLHISKTSLKDRAWEYMTKYTVCSSAMNCAGESSKTQTSTITIAYWSSWVLKTSSLLLKTWWSHGIHSPSCYLLGEGLGLLLELGSTSANSRLSNTRSALISSSIASSSSIFFHLLPFHCCRPSVSTLWGQKHLFWLLDIGSCFW